MTALEKEATQAEVRAILHKIGLLIVGASTERVGQNVACVLSALRGPDSDNYELKRTTTAVIRHAAFQEACQRRVLELFGTVNGGHIKMPSTWEDYHFLGHVQRAAEALGLEIEYYDA